MTAIDDKDRDVLRFIWIDDTTKDEPELRVFRFAGVVFGVLLSPFLLNTMIKFNLEHYLESNKVIVNRLLNSTYVEDIVTGADLGIQSLCPSKEHVRIQPQKVFHQH